MTTTRIKILNLNPDTSAMDLWKTVAGFAGFPFDTFSPIIEGCAVRSPFNNGAVVRVSVGCCEGRNPVLQLDSSYSADCENTHNEIVTKLIAHINETNPGATVLSRNKYKDQWVVNAAPYDA